MQVNQEVAMNLNDTSLFRQQCYVDGQWLDADSGATIDVTNPADNSVGEHACGQLSRGHIGSVEF